MCSGTKVAEVSQITRKMFRYRFFKWLLSNREPIIFSFLRERTKSRTLHDVYTWKFSSAEFLRPETGSLTAHRGAFYCRAPVPKDARFVFGDSKQWNVLCSNWKQIFCANHGRYLFIFMLHFKSVSTRVLVRN